MLLLLPFYVAHAAEAGQWLVLFRSTAQHNHTPRQPNPRECIVPPCWYNPAKRGTPRHLLTSFLTISHVFSDPETALEPACRGPAGGWLPRATISNSSSSCKVRIEREETSTSVTRLQNLLVHELPATKASPALETVSVVTAVVNRWASSGLLQPNSRAPYNVPDERLVQPGVTPSNRGSGETL